MGVWLEIHCDTRSSGPAEKHGSDLLRPWCESDANCTPGTMTKGDRASMLDGLRRLEEEAKSKGWHRGRSGHWICPRCLRMFKSGEVL